jgi:release factor glutamine methyltransferase
MTYETLCHRLSTCYEAGEAKALVRWVLDVRFGLSLTDIICGKVTQLSADDQAELEKIMQRLEKGEPVQYIIGVADFAGRQFKVAPGVLIPRPETAELCEWVVSEAQNASQLLDIGTGSGCIAITLAAELPHAKVSAWDISDDALRIASGNASLLGANVTFEKHDILDTAIATDTQPIYDVIVSNPPYIKLSERDGMAKNVRDYEPDIALFAPEANPIIFYQKIAHFAWKNLREGGRLFFELNPLTSEAVGDDLRQLGFSDIEFRQDLYGKQRFLKATKI